MRAVSSVQVALWAQAITNIAVLYTLLRVLHALLRATYIIGGEGTFVK